MPKAAKRSEPCRGTTGASSDILLEFSGLDSLSSLSPPTIFLNLHFSVRFGVRCKEDHLEVFITLLNLTFARMSWLKKANLKELHESAKSQVVSGKV